jgi:hypothetical protein
MRKLTSLQLPAWSLPLIAVAICVPAVAAFALGGPGAGMAAGALLGAAILVIAARSRFDEEIEVAAPAPGQRAGVLVVATAPVEGDGAVDAVGAAAAEGDGGEVLVLAPALNTMLSHWASDLGRARLEAQERLAVSIAELAKAGIEARGMVGDTDAVQAVEDTLRSFAAREVVCVTAPGATDRLAGELRRRLDRRVVEVASGAPGRSGERARMRS